jgi:hypothetical protein
MTPKSYVKAAKRLREFADELELCAAIGVPAQTAAQLLVGLERYAHHLVERNKL